MATLMFIIGGHGLAVQAVVMRELMAAYAGNELTAAVVLGGWLGAEALGAGLAGSGAGSPARLFAAGIAAAVLSALVVPAAVLSRLLFGLLAGELPGLAAVAGAAALVAAVPAFLHGVLFVEGCRRYAAGAGVSGVGRGYAWEGLGTAVAGGIVAVVLLAAGPGLLVVAGFGVLLVLACGPVAGTGRLPVAVAVTAILLAPAFGARAIERWSVRLAWPGFQVVDVRDSPFGKTVTLTREGERVVVYDGVVVAAFPPADARGVEQSSIVPLLYAAGASDVLLLGGSPQAIEPLLRLPVATVTCVVQDRMLFDRLAAAGGSSAAAADRRVRLVFDDPRRFLRRTPQEFDCIISAGSEPLSLAASRLATVEYFRLCRRRLRAGGVVGVPLPGSVSGAGRAGARLLAVSRATLAAAFDTVLVLALDAPLLVAGQTVGRGLAEAAARLADWRRDGPVGGVMLDSAGLAQLLDSFRQDRWKIEVAGAAGPAAGLRPSTDGQPRALFPALARRSGATGPAGLGDESSARIPVPTVAAIGMAALLALGVLAVRRGDAARRMLAVATSGFAGSALVTVGMLAYQAVTGALYIGIVLLLACFMLGTVIGGSLGTAADARPRRGRGFIAAESALVACPALVLLAGRFAPGWVQFALLAAAGCAIGFQFPVAAAGTTGEATGRRVGRLAAFDLAGGLLGVAAIPLLVLPAAGAVWACGSVAAVKLVSLAVQLVPGRGH
jgi:predicted membrane-bound spermidine synthase